MCRSGDPATLRGQFIEQGVVPVLPDAEGADPDPGRPGLVGQSQALGLVSVGPAVGEEDQVGAGARALGPQQLVEARREPVVDLRPPLRCHGVQAGPQAVPLRGGAHGPDHLGPIVEGHHPQAILRLQVIGQFHRRRLRLFQAGPFHRIASIDHQAQVQRRARACSRPGRLEGEEDVEDLGGRQGGQGWAAEEHLYPHQGLGAPPAGLPEPIVFGPPLRVAEHRIGFVDQAEEHGGAGPWEDIGVHLPDDRPVGLFDLL